MRVFRLSKRKYANELSGKGAAKFGNRWNSKGVEIIYTSQSRALAMAEVVVHLSLATLPSDFVMMEIQIPEELEIQIIGQNSLSNNWISPHMIHQSQNIGDQFINDHQFCVMKVPSAIVPGDFNYLINPHDNEFKKIRIVNIVNFPFDKRMFV